MSKLWLYLATFCSLSVVSFASPPSGFWQIEVHAQAANAFRSSHFADSIADRYGSNWQALRIPLANGLAYEQTPGMLLLKLGIAQDSTWEIRTSLPIRRDLEAWHQDPTALNLFYNTNEVDINMPIEAVAWWHSEHQTWTIGRQKLEFGPSARSILLGSAPPFHDLLRWEIHTGVFRFDWIASSLNPHLTGTPSQVGAITPIGSEAWQQANLTISNQRKRTYTEPYKNLFVHRLGGQWNWGWLSLTEQALIAGKSPAFRDFNPWMIWHDNYGDGYTKSSLMLETGFHPINGATVYGQINFEDIASPVGETVGETAPTTLGALAGWHQVFLEDTLWKIDARLDAIYTDPAYNNHRLPLLKMASRRLYRSNYRAQGADSANTPYFADSYIVDYPLGYFRGPDAIDLWFDASLHNKMEQWRMGLQIAWLRQGSMSLENTWDEAASHSGALSGIEEKEFRIAIDLQKQWNTFGVDALLGWQSMQNTDHILGNDQQNPQWKLAFHYSLSSKGK